MASLISTRENIYESQDFLTSMIGIRITKNQIGINEALKIREEVFINEQNVSPDAERDGFDNSSEHAIVYYNSKPIGTARIRYKGNNMKLESIAILGKFRGKNLGSELMNFLVQYGKERGVNEIYIHAQHHLFDFYSKFGFKQRGDIFYNINIKHLEMFLSLKN